MKYRRVVMILADGARPDVFQDLLQKGKLPSIADRLPHFREGVTAFPSTTGPAYMPYLTGCYPGTCNVPGIRWFDKTEYQKGIRGRHKYRSYVGAETFYIGRDMDPQIHTLFDLIPNSYNLFNSVSRGVKRRHNKTWFSRIWYWYYAHLTDHWKLVDRAAGEKTLHLLEENPEFLFVVFPGIDEHSHLASPLHPETLHSYQDLDRAVGEIGKKLNGRWEETALFIVSDHGLSETRTHFELHTLFEDPFYYPRVVFRHGFDSSVMISGNGMAHIYLKGKDGWRGRMNWEDITGRSDRVMERLLERPEIDLVAGQRGDGSVMVKSRRGEAIITPPKRSYSANPADLLRAEAKLPLAALALRGGLSYVVQSSDPFGYPPLPSQMSDRESLDRTFATDYPDALAQLLQIFRSPRTGDLVVSATPGFDLRDRYEIPEHKSSHGSLHREQMMIPIVTNVPLPQQPVRSVDLFPTVLGLLGRPVPTEIDGESLFPLP